jgi:ketosteroid isomerase-like protein
MHPNGQLIQRGFDAFARGDMETIDGLFSDDITWHLSGTSVLSGEYHGKEQVFGLFGRLLELTEGTFHQEIHAILADDEHVVVIVSSGQDKPRPFAGNSVFVWHVRDGKAIECWDIQGDQAAAAAALA